jgi:ubiquinone/menaquinone biosynthesis C-methylase UbiE
MEANGFHDVTYRRFMGGVTVVHSGRKA